MWPFLPDSKNEGFYLHFLAHHWTNDMQNWLRGEKNPQLTSFWRYLIQRYKSATFTFKLELTFQSPFPQSQSQLQLLQNAITILIHSRNIDFSAKKHPLISKIDWNGKTCTHSFFHLLVLHSPALLPFRCWCFPDSSLPCLHQCSLQPLRPPVWTSKSTPASQAFLLFHVPDTATFVH